MTATFDISALYQKAFGVGRGKPFDPNQANDIGYVEVSFPETIESDDEEGTEFVNMRNTLQATLPSGQALFMPVRLGGELLPNEPSLSLYMPKNVVKTSLAGSQRKGTVKELIGIDDYQITIRGLCINLQSKLVYPEDQVKLIRDLAEQKESLVIESALTNLLGVYRLVIESVSFPEMIGIQHAQAYELRCLSDEDFELEIL